MSLDSGHPGLTVLYVEDNASNLQLVKRILRDRRDVDLYTASRGQEGIDLARSLLPGVILLDLHLPDMPGADVLGALHSDPLTAEIPIVAVSADATAEQMRNLRGMGVADYVTKPFEVPRLLAVIDSFMTPGHFPKADPILDADRLAELVGLDTDGATFRSLATTALDEAARQIAAIAEAPVAGRGAAAVSAAAHSLKSSAAIIGARRLASLADLVEQTARTGYLPDPPVLSELRRTLTATRQATLEAMGER